MKKRYYKIIVIILIGILAWILIPKGINNYRINHAKKDFYQVILYKNGETLETITLEENTEEFDEYTRLFIDMINQSQLRNDCKCAGYYKDTVDRVKNNELPDSYDESEFISIEMLSHSSEYTSLFIYGPEFFLSEESVTVGYSINNSFEGRRDIYLKTDTIELREYVKSLFDN